MKRSYIKPEAFIENFALGETMNACDYVITEQTHGPDSACSVTIRPGKGFGSINIFAANDICAVTADGYCYTQAVDGLAVFNS